MNHPFVMDCARALVRRPDVASLKETPARSGSAASTSEWPRATAEEQRLASEYLQAQGQSPAAWERYAHALLLVNELVMVD